MCRHHSLPIAVLLAAAASLLVAQTPRTVKVVFPAEHNEPLSNPYMGFGLWAGPRYFDGRAFTVEYNTSGFGDDAPLFGWVLIDWMWADLEPAEGRYSWKDLDAIIDFWAQRKKQIYLRVWITDDPGWNDAPGNEVCPEWLWAAGIKYRRYTGEGKVPKREPDYLDPSYEKLYLPRAKRFLSALAARYDKPDSPVALWGAMGYGQWGEWHTMWSRYPWRDKEEKHAVLAKIVQMYAEVFTVRPLMISYGYDDGEKGITGLADYHYRQALDVALSKGFGLALHSFIDDLMIWERLAMEKYWWTTPMLAEANWSYADVKDHRTHGTLAENVRMFAEWHSNYGHFYMDAASYRRAMREDRTAFEDGLRSGGIGYRLAPMLLSWPEELRAGDLLVLRSRWVNRNAGRCYVRFPLRIYFTDEDGAERFSASDEAFSETGWVAGAEYPVTTILRTPRELRPGTYDLRIALADQTGRPSLRLPIAGEDAQLRYGVGTIRIR